MSFFRWRTRTKTSEPSIAGSSTETLASHVSDTNAHPDYLKKGSSVPTGQESWSVKQHQADKVAHAPNSIRRDEATLTRQDYLDHKSQSWVNNPNSYYGGTPARHMITANVLNEILAGYVDVDMFKNVIKRHYYNQQGDITYTGGTLKDVGDGSQLIYIKSEEDGFGYAVLSSKTIGATNKPVFLKNGVITAFSTNIGTDHSPVYIEGGVVKAVPYTCVYTTTDQTINGRKTFTTIPNVSDANTVGPVDDADLVTLKYLKTYQIPVGGIYTHVFKTARTSSSEPVAFTGAEITAKVGYGTWVIKAYAGDYACMYERTA